MLKQPKTNSPDFLLSVPIPTRTKSYSPVSHGDFIDMVRDEVTGTYGVIKSETYMSNNNGEVFIGYFDVDSGDTEFGYRIAFRNSYNKMKRAAVVSGTNVWICENGCVFGEHQFIRKHTGNIIGEMKENLKRVLGNTEATLLRTYRMKQKLTSMGLKKNLMYNMLGDFIMNDIITTPQANVFKQQFINPAFKYEDKPSMWGVYNHFTHALKGSNVNTAFKSQQVIQDAFEYI